MDSVKYGPEGLVTASNYFEMGKLYQSKRDYPSTEGI
jgi:hypothetical protein